MAKNGDVQLEFNQEFFDTVLKSPEVEALTKEKATEALQIAQYLAPVDTGDYGRGLHIERVEFAYRTGYQVVGDDWKTMILEDEYHVLANAIKQVK